MVRWLGRAGKKGWLVELRGNQNVSPEAKKDKRGRTKKDHRRRATAIEAMGKSCGIGITERKEIRGDEPIKFYPLTGVRSAFVVVEEVMANEVPHNKEISRGERMEEEKKSILLFV